MTTQTDYAVCILCAAACGIEVEHDGKRALRVRGDERDPLSQGHICPKGVALAEAQNDPDRLRSPMRRQGDRWFEIGWDEALDEAAERLVAIQNEYGADAVASYIGNPTAHSFGAVMSHGVLLDAIDSKNRYSANSVDGLPRNLASHFLYGNWMASPIPDLERTQFLLMLGANPMVSNGSVMGAPDFARWLRAMQARGGRLVTVDPRRNETAALADAHYFIRPGTDALFLSALLNVLFAENLADPKHLKSLVAGWEDLPELFEEYTPERVAPVVGIDAQSIAQLAREFAAAESAVCYGRMGTCVQEFGTLASWLTDLVTIVTGNLDRPGGAMFTTPAFDAHRLAKIIGLGGAFDRWRSRVGGYPEFNRELPVAAFAEEMDTPGDGQVRGLVTHAGNPALSLPNGQRITRALSKLHFMVSIDIYRNETTRFADIILPPTFGLERDHYPALEYAVAVRNVARYSPAVLDKPKGALHDWEILTQLAGRVGKARGRKGLPSRVRAKLLGSLGPRSILRLMLRLGPQPVSLSTLEQQPHGIDLGSLKPALSEILGKQGKIQLIPDRMRSDLPRLRSKLDTLPATGSNGLLLIGRRHLRNNNSWMHNTELLVKGRDRCVLLMNPEDAEQRHLSGGQRVVLKSQVGQVEVPMEISDEVMPGVVSLPHGFGHGRQGAQLRVAADHAGASINDVTDDSAIDALSGTSILNGVPVNVVARGRAGAGCRPGELEEAAPRIGRG